MHVTCDTNSILINQCIFQFYTQLYTTYTNGTIYYLSNTPAQVKIFKLVTYNI